MRSSHGKSTWYTAQAIAIQLNSTTKRSIQSRFIEIPLIQFFLNIH
jgi:hypothetical protein